jgi:hypothetical protein
MSGQAFENGTVNVSRGLEILISTSLGSAKQICERTLIHPSCQQRVRWKTLDLTIRVAKAHVWHNEILSTDVTGDGHTAANDAVDVIDFINAFGSQAVPIDGRAGGPYRDVDGDGFVAPSDAAVVINQIDAFPEAEGEVAGSQQPAIRNQGSDQEAGIGDLVAMLAADVAEQAKRKR